MQMPNKTANRSVKKPCQWQGFSVGRSSSAARRERKEKYDGN